MMTLKEQAMAALEAVRNEPIIAYDTEGSGLDWKKNHVVGYVITVDEERNWYIPVRHGGGANLLDPNVPALETPEGPFVQHWFEKELADAFQERRAKGLLTVGHHIKFDMHFSANAGIYLGRDCGDTGINEVLLDEYSFSYSLDSCAKKHDVPAKLGQVMYDHLSSLGFGPAKKDIMAYYWRTAGNDEIAVDYAKGDGITTLRLWEAQMKKILEPDAQGFNMELVHRVESRLIWTIFRMERRGIKVDSQYIQDLTDAISEELKEARAKLPEGFNPRSPVQTRAVMEAAGETNWPTTAKGAPSFTEGFLKKSETGRAIINIRQLMNLLSKFVDPLVNEHIHNGRVHAHLNQLKTDESGTAARFSCSDPNLQAIPKRNKKLGPRFRRVFIADEGMLFYEADYSQCEPCLFAHFSREPALVEGYSMDPPRDMHAVVADMFDVERDPTAKRMNMGMLTGMQARTFAAHMDWPLDKATQMWNKWFEGFPGIRAFQANAKALIRERGYVRTLLGRRGHREDARFDYKATSKIIQGGNADIMKYKILEIDEWLESIGDPAHLLMTVHDSLLWQAPDTEEGRAISKRITEIMVDVQTPPFNLRVPFRVDFDSGYSWAVATYGDLAREMFKEAA